MLSEHAMRKKNFRSITIFLDKYGILVIEFLVPGVFRKLNYIIWILRFPNIN